MGWNAYRYPQTLRRLTAFGFAVLFGTGVSGCAHTPSPSSAVATGPRPPIEVLSEVGHYRLRSDGRKTYTYEVRYRVQAEAGAKAWRRLETQWAPWHQERPEVSATVHTPDGRTLHLDPSTVEVGPVEEGQHARQALVAPIPGVVVGALVEQRIVQRERATDLSGTSGRFHLGMRVPVARSELVLEFPKDLVVTVDVQGRTLEPEVEEDADFRRLRYVVENLPPVGPVDKHLPPDLVRHPYIAFSTLPNWTSVVEPLLKRFERSLRGAEVESLLQDLAPDALRTTILQEAVDRVRTLTRFNGRRLNEGPPVAMHPEETLARGAGGDIDVAALLISVLRSRGIQAHVALMRAGPGQDVGPNLPGLEGFDRVLVRVDGPAPVWIDPVARFHPPGTLPPNVQGRRALVLKPGTHGLERTPRLASLDNWYAEKRIIEMPAFGAPRVIETTRAAGSIGARLRARLHSEANPRSALESYVRTAYGRADLGAVKTSDPLDLRDPVEVTLEALETNAGEVDVTSAYVEFRPAPLFSWLPLLIRDAALARRALPKGREAELRQLAAVLVQRRKLPLELPEPYVADLEFEVRPPPGFEPVSPPKDRTVQLGPAVFSARYSVQQGILTGHFRFDTGSERLGPEQLKALVDGLRTLWAEPSVRVQFEHRGARALRDGRIEEGVQSFAEIAAAHPSSPAHRARLALALVEIGLGHAARQVAREAVALDESSVIARYVHGRVLSHDLVGQLYAPGFDREGAMDALRLVKALDPGHVRARAELAVLRSTDDRGLRYTNPAVVEAAVAEYRSLREDTGVRAFDDQLIEALLVAERFEEVIAEAEDARRSLRRDGHVLAARIALDRGLSGLDPLIQSLEIPEGALPLVETAAATALAGIGRYSEARALLERMRAADRLKGPLARQAARIAALRPLQELLRPASDPVRVVQTVLSKALVGGASANSLRELMDERYDGPRLKAEAERLTRAFGAFARAAERSRVPPRVLRDSILSETKYKVDGDSRMGFRVRALLEGRRPTWWFVRTAPASSTYRIVATGANPGALGNLALEALQDGQTEIAETWLRWAEDLLKPGAASSGDAFRRLPFARLRESRPNTPALAALALAALGPMPDRAIVELEKRALKSNSKDVLDHARLLGLIREARWPEALPIVRRLVRNHPKSGSLRELEVAALLELERWPAAERAIRAQLREKPKDPEVLEQLANLETGRGRFRRAEAILEELAERQPERSSIVYNNLAWVALFRGDVGPRDLERALKANRLSKGRSPAELHTLAAHHAEQGNTVETVKLVRRRLELRDADDPDNEDYYLFGRLMEHLGLWRLARQAYLEVKKGDGGRADSTHALAQQRLRGLARRSAI